MTVAVATVYPAHNMLVRVSVDNLHEYRIIGRSYAGDVWYSDKYGHQYGIDQMANQIRSTAGISEVLVTTGVNQYGTTVVDVVSILVEPDGDMNLIDAEVQRWMANYLDYSPEGLPFMSDRYYLTGPDWRLGRRDQVVVKPQGARGRLRALLPIDPEEDRKRSEKLRTEGIRYELAESMRPKDKPSTRKYGQLPTSGRAASQELAGIFYDLFLEGAKVTTLRDVVSVLSYQYVVGAIQREHFRRVKETNPMSVIARDAEAIYPDRLRHDQQIPQEDVNRIRKLVRRSQIRTP